MNPVLPPASARGSTSETQVRVSNGKDGILVISGAFKFETTGAYGGRISNQSPRAEVDHTFLDKRYVLIKNIP